MSVARWLPAKRRSEHLGLVVRALGPGAAASTLAAAESRRSQPLPRRSTFRGTAHLRESEMRPQGSPRRVDPPSRSLTHKTRELWNRRCLDRDGTGGDAFRGPKLVG